MLINNKYAAPAGGGSSKHKGIGQNKIQIRKKKLTKVEIKKLQEKYEDPESKKGKPRSHVGNLQYGIMTLGENGTQVMSTNKLGRYAAELGMDEIANKIREEIQVPVELANDIRVLLTGAGEKPDHAKHEMDLRLDQKRLRKMIKIIGDYCDQLISRTINREQKDKVEKQLAMARYQ